MRISKKILAFLMAALMLVSVMPLTALADGGGAGAIGGPGGGPSIIGGGSDPVGGIPGTAGNGVPTFPATNSVVGLVNPGKGAYYYISLEDAIADAEEGAVITAIADIVATEPIVIPAGADIQIDLNGHSISGNITDSSKKLIQVYGKVEFVGGSGCIYNTNTTAQGHAACQALTGGTIIVNAPIHFGDSDTDMTNANTVNRGCGIQNNGGTLIINDGYYTAIDSDYSVKPNAYAYAILNCSGDTIVNDATVYGHPNGSLGCEGGTLTVNGGTYEVKSGNYYNLYAGYSGVITVNDGTFIDNGSHYAVCVLSSSWSGAAINILGGDFTYSVPFKQSGATDEYVNISGGTFSTDVTNYCADGFYTAYDSTANAYVVKKYGTVQKISNGDATITGNGTAHETITLENVSMPFSPANASVGRYWDAYYIGIRLLAPEGTNISEAARYTNGSVDSTTGELKIKNLYSNKDGANYMDCWPHVTPESLDEAVQAGVNKTWQYTIDWDGDGVFEQTVDIVIVANSVRLVKDGKQVYPEEPNNGANISVADEISQNVYIDTDFYGEESYATIEYNHASNASEDPDFQTETVQLKDLPSLDDPSSAYDGASMLSVIQAPAQSTEPITINIYATAADAAAGTNAVDTIEYSVYNYCKKIIDEYEGEKATELKGLAKATLDYAAAAQEYFNYNTDNMATKDATGDYYGDVATADLSSVAGISSRPLGVSGVTVVVKSDLEINLLTKTPFTVTGRYLDTDKGGTRFDADMLPDMNGDYYVLNIKGIEPANMNKTITVYTTQGTAELTANSVMKLMAAYGDAKMQTLAKAMYLYGQAADTYFNA